MCKLLGVPRSLVYYNLNKDQEAIEEKSAKEEELINEIKEIFRKSKNNYGSRKIKVELEKKGLVVSRRKISKIMIENGLVSNYTVKQYKPKKNIM